MERFKKVYHFLILKIPSKFYLGIILILAGTICALLIHEVALTKTLNSLTTTPSPLSFRQIRENVANEYKYINPLLGCEATVTTSLQSFPNLRAKLTNEINKRKNNHDIEEVSIYYDNRNGRWLGINTQEKYSPASMMKVPLMIAVFKKAENNPSFLTEKIIYDGNFNFNQEQNFKPTVTLMPGHAYTVKELMEHLIKYSDNNAGPLLEAAVGKKEFKEVSYDLGISLPSTPLESTQDFIPIKDYTNFFRVLYNATYLNREYSEKALELLATHNFSSGIVGGVPSTTPVAQKFGERNFVDDSGQSTLKELHDCGIVYYPQFPYLLCIMTKGHDFNKLAETIQSLSAITYQAVDTTHNPSK